MGPVTRARKRANLWRFRDLGRSQQRGPEADRRAPSHGVRGKAKIPRSWKC